MATDESWQIACEAGRKATLDALQEKLRRRIERGASERDLMALLIGGLGGIAQMMHAAAKPERLAVVEAIALAYLRGPIRGFDRPVNPDGSEFKSQPLDQGPGAFEDTPP
jgi:hypothetical protein